MGKVVVEESRTTELDHVVCGEMGRFVDLHRGCSALGLVAEVHRLVQRERAQDARVAHAVNLVSTDVALVDTVDTESVRAWKGEQGAYLIDDAARILMSKM